MTKGQIAAINIERLDRWGKTLTRSHATPMILLGVGHDHVSGQLQVCACEDGPSDAELALFLRTAADTLEGK